MTDVRDRILGCIFGHALGDAIGHAGGTWPPPEPSDGTPHYDKGDWTEETDNMILVMRSMACEDTGAAFVKQLVQWSAEGFAELGDTAIVSNNPIIAALLKDPKFAEDPQTAAQTMWENRNRDVANNGSLARTTPVGCLANIDEIPALATELSCTTHFDPRCVVCCVVHSVLIHELIYGSPVGAFEKAISKAKDMCAASEIDFDNTIGKELAVCCKVGMTGLIDDLALGDMGKLSQSYPALSCSFYALQLILYSQRNGRRPSYQKIVRQVASAGGDSDAHAALAGSILGAHLGYSGLPAEWIVQMPHADWLKGVTEAFMDTLEV